MLTSLTLTTTYEPWQQPRFSSSVCTERSYMRQAELISGEFRYKQDVSAERLRNDENIERFVIICGAEAPHRKKSNLTIGYYTNF